MSFKAINEQHGGNLSAAVAEYGGHPEDWLDLSAGIAPWPYHDLSVPESVWARLPAKHQELIEAAAYYYGCPAQYILPLAGSQQAITSLPKLFPHRRVAIPSAGYFEHRLAWQKAGHQLCDYRADQVATLEQLVDDGHVDIAVVINPNNPTTSQFSPKTLLDIAEALQTRNGLLIVDEAFADCHPELSLAAHAGQESLLVLRSAGKFFGLAGLRLGFALTHPRLKAALEEQLPCWHLSGPAELLGTRMLQDRRWQQQQQRRIVATSQQLHRLLGNNLPAKHFEIRRSALFTTVFGSADHALQLKHSLASQKIWTRSFILPDKRGAVRLGLPREKAQIRRLKTALINASW